MKQNPGLCCGASTGHGDQRGWRRLGVGGVLVAWLLTGCHPDAGTKPLEEPAGPPVPVRTAVVETRSREALEEVVGTVRSRTRAVLEAKVSGRIERMDAVPGRTVEAGAVLVELDVQETRARVEQARAVLQQAEREYDRVAGLFKEDAVTRAEMESVEARRRVARAAVVETEAMLEHARITAPFAGVITRKRAEVGDLAVPGRPLLELEDPKMLRFEADVPATLEARVRLGQELAVRIAGVDALITGRVSEVEPSADTVSRTFRVRLDLPPGTGARGGAFGRMFLPLEAVSVTVVPTNSVVQRGQMEMVWVLADGRARLRLVKTGKRLGDGFEVLSGLESGDKVVVEGAAQLKDGQPVVAP